MDQRQGHRPVDAVAERGQHQNPEACRSAWASRQRHLREGTHRNRGRPSAPTSELDVGDAERPGAGCSSPWPSPLNVKVCPKPASPVRRPVVCVQTSPQPAGGRADDETEGPVAAVGDDGLAEGDAPTLAVPGSPAWNTMAGGLGPSGVNVCAGAGVCGVSARSVTLNGPPAAACRRGSPCRRRFLERTPAGQQSVSVSVWPSGSRAPFVTVNFPGPRRP